MLEKSKESFALQVATEDSRNFTINKRTNEKNEKPMKTYISFKQHQHSTQIKKRNRTIREVSPWNDQ